MPVCRLSLHDLDVAAALDARLDLRADQFPQPRHAPHHLVAGAASGFCIA
jgi:hypothetical protein